MQSNDQISEQPRLAVFIVKAEDLHIGVMSKTVNLYINALGRSGPVTDFGRVNAAWFSALYPGGRRHTPVHVI